MKYDAIIVGGGPAGSSAAIHLARRGCRVLLLERQRVPREKLCGEFIAPEAIPPLERLGLLPTLAAAGASVITGGALIAVTGERVAASFGEFDRTPGYGFGLSRRVLDHLLWQTARQSGADVLDRFYVRRLILSGNRVTGVIGSVAGSEREMRFHADVIVDATGRAHSLISPENPPRPLTPSLSSAAFFPPRRKHRSIGMAFRVHLSDVAEIEQEVELYFYPGGYGGLIPIEGGLFNLCAITTWDIVRRTRGDAHRLIEATMGASPVAREKVRHARVVGKVLGVGPLAFGLVPWTTGIIRIGDARGELDPFLGQGIGLALQSGELAARLIAEATDRRNSSEIAERYEACYRATFGRRFLIARLLRPVALSPRWGRHLLSFLDRRWWARNFALRATRAW